MDQKERYEREAKAKGGSVPPDLRREHHHSDVHAGSEKNVTKADQRREQDAHMRERARKEEQ